MLPVEIFPNRGLRGGTKFEGKSPCAMFFLLLKRVQEHFLLQNIATVIVKSVGKVAFFTSFSPASGPVSSKMLFFVRVIIVLLH